MVKQACLQPYFNRRGLANVHCEPGSNWKALVSRFDNDKGQGRAFDIEVVPGQRHSRGVYGTGREMVVTRAGWRFPRNRELFYSSTDGSVARSIPL